MTGVEILTVVYGGAKLIKFCALVSKGSVSKFCFLKGSGRNTCSNHFRQKIAEGKVHIFTEHLKEVSRKIGKDLFSGNSNIGKSLEEFKGTPQYTFRKAFEKDELVNVPENLEIIKSRIEEVGPAEFFRHILDAVQFLL